MNIVHLTASTFLGGPERQMLGLAQSLAPDSRSVFISFAERGRCRAFLERGRLQGFKSLALEHDTPRFQAAIREMAQRLREHRADVLCCHGYKANLLGRWAARRVGIPVIAISRGWTGENLKVRLYERLDRWCLRWMDRVVCVSEAQAAKVRRAGVPPHRIRVIRNAIRPERFDRPDPIYRRRLQGLFARPRRRIIGAAGRLSAEKGFGVLVEAAKQVVRRDSSIGFVLFGEGSLRSELEREIRAAGLRGKFVLPGFRDNLDRFLPFFDVLVLPSFTEGLPNVVLEAFAAGVPVVATAVGGTPEVVEDGVSGYLIPPGEPEPVARRILELLASEARRREMGQSGRQRVLGEFTFEAQSEQYRRLFEELVGAPRAEEMAEKVG